MEITTIITWNAGLYLMYYGTLFFLDYRRFQGRKAQGVPVFSYKESLETTPVKVRASTYQVEPQSSADEHEPSVGITQAEEKDQVPVFRVDGRIGDQGLPMDEFIRNAGDYSSNIDF